MDILLRRSNARDIIFIILGTFLMALGINLIYDPMQMVTGGVTGIAILVKYLTEGIIEGGIPLWATNTALNVPLFLVAFKVLGFKTVAKTLLATGSLSLFLYLIPMTPMFEEDFLLASVFGGVLAGLGIGLVFATMSTTGGTDMLGMLIQKKIPHYSLPQLVFIIDGLIVIAGAVVFGISSALYSIIAVYVTAKVSGTMLDGMKFAKCAYIISEKYREIADEILSTMDRGVTGLHAQGMYSNSDKKVLFCVVSKKEMVEVLDIVHKNDTSAFVIVTDVREVMGEGFIEYKQ